MNFHETIAGKRFFESQLPMLITALQDISKKMTLPASVIRLPKANPDFLTGLYRNSGIYEPTQESKAINHAAIKAQDDFLPFLSKEGRMAFDKYQEIAADRSEEFASRAYRLGFQTAMQMLACGMAIPPKEKSKNDGTENL